MTSLLRQGTWRKYFVGVSALALIILFASYQIRLNELAQTDAKVQLELRVDTLYRRLARLEDVVAIHGYSRDPPSDSLVRGRRLARDFMWLKFLRRCAERKSLRLLLLQDSLVRSVDAAGHSHHRLSVETLLLNVTNIALHDRDVGDFVDAVVQTLADLPTASPSPPPPSDEAAAAVLPFSVDLILADAVQGTIEKVPVTNASSAILVELTSKATSKSRKTLFGFSFFDGRRGRVNVSVLYEKKNAGVDPEYPGYYFLPWSWTGFPMAFPHFATKRVEVEAFEAGGGGELFQMPTNSSHFLWQSAASNFIPCDAQRNAVFAKKSFKPASLDRVKDKARIKEQMALVIALQSSLATWHRRNWIFGGTLLGWYRQCSLIPHDQDMDTASWISDFDDWMIEYYRKHPLVKMYVKFGLKDDSLEFKMGDKRKKTIDLFWMYPGPAANQSWLGIQTFDGKYTKKISLYPVVDKICSADLHGYLVYVPCDPWPIIKTEYGAKNWFEPNPKYDYKSDAFNWRVNGSWTAKQWRGGAVYKVFQ